MTDDPEQARDAALEAAYAAGLAAEKAGDAQEAAARFRACLILDPEDHGGAAMRLAALGAAPDPERAPPAYVATLFDQTADAFERILVDDLGYRTPWDIAATLEGMGRAQFARALDLGCGTGLLGEALEGRCAYLSGVDLSAEMLEIAAEKDLYQELVQAEAEAFLRDDARRWDLIAAADILPYLGALEGAFGAAAKRLDPEGVFIASAETLPEDQFGATGWRVGAGHRFHHGRAYLETSLRAAGLTPLGFAPVTVRMERGAPAGGWLFAARANPDLSGRA